MKFKKGERLIGTLTRNSGSKVEFEGEVHIGTDRAFPYIIQGVCFREEEVRRDDRVRVDAGPRCMG